MMPKFVIPLHLFLAVLFQRIMCPNYSSSPAKCAVQGSNSFALIGWLLDLPLLLLVSLIDSLFSFE